VETLLAHHAPAPATAARLTVGYFLAENENGPDYDSARRRREQDGWAEHADFMDALVDDGFIVLGGPIGDVDGERTLLLIRADDEDTVRARLAEDPWQGSILRLASVEPWTLWLGSPPAG
jgi:uncharacterized protein YciI